MDFKLLLIPAAIFAVAIIINVVRFQTNKKNTGHAQDVMRNYAAEQIPVLRGVNYDVVDILVDAISTVHMWVVAYNADGMYLIPSVANPFTHTINRYEDDTSPDIKKQIGNTAMTFKHVQTGKQLNVTVSRVKKHYLPSLALSGECWIYNFYFAEYEGIELPCTLSVIKNDLVDSITFTEQAVI